MIRLTLLAALGAACLSPLAQAEYHNERFNQNYVWEADKPWEEKPIPLPAYPDGAHWQSFEVGPTTRNQHAIDTHTLSIGEDGVVRFALRVQSPDGAETLTFDGLRCETREHKRYAIGRSDTQTWSPSRLAQWRRLEQGQAVLRTVEEDYLCPDRSPARNVAEVIKRMKQR